MIITSEQSSNNITCILTSCGRFDLLARTLQSFYRYNQYPVTDFFIYEDSGIKIPTAIKHDYPNIIYIEPGTPTGQIKALDTLWDRVKTKYAFQMEDDWLTLQGGFIEKSISVLNSDPKIMQVWLQPLEPNNSHPIDWNLNYGILKSNEHLWSGIRFNPSVKRKSDYDIIGSFGEHTTFNKRKAWKSEATIAKLYTSLGFKAAILKDAYIRHIGINRHCI